MPEESGFDIGPKGIDMRQERKIAPIDVHPNISTVQKPEGVFFKGKEILPIGGGEPWLYADEGELDRVGNRDAKNKIKDLERMWAKFPRMVTGRVLEEAFMFLEDIKNKERDAVKKDVIEEYQAKIYEEIIRKTVGEKGEAKAIEVGDSTRPESYIKAVLSALQRLEEKASGDDKKFDDFEGDLQAIRNVIASIPAELNARTSKDDELTRVLLIGKGEIRLKEKLELILEARRRLHDRRFEVLKADGDLQKLGTGSPEGGPVDFTDLRPVDFYVLIHQDDMFITEARGLGREIVASVAGALKLWQRVGEGWDTGVIAGVPTLRRALNSPEQMRDLRSAIAAIVGKNAEKIAFGIFTITMTFDKWDKMMEKRGRSDVRDLIYFDEKRRQDFYDKEATAGPAHTVGAYFAKEHQGEVSSTGDPDYQKPPKSKVQKERLELLKFNAQYPIFKYSVRSLDRGPFTGDLWEVTTTNFLGSKSTLADVARRASWKDIKFFELGEGFYKSYFGFILRSAEGLSKQFTKTGWDVDKDGLMSPDFWSGLNKDMSRISLLSPALNTKPPAETNARVEMFKVMFARGVFWDGSSREAMSQDQANKVLQAIERAGFLRKDPIKYLLHFINKYKYKSIQK